ncbi:PQQ-binding-like beta-propeller repeat protein [Kordiimonas sp. SCSIO 12610]|uniref:outer membrane protein assembly factor BamB family protein n=1 Tax=Kordiimonas sp. SCSIO 12610 TaxID=2829597 RepID=UPI00210B359C|nr:PQQ-binding-like beta-propeller repeat protein [Kordiimonas sp. SCSIO 12610]UTW53897.1 PQQ-binding-like beta-propeller repeat protein [Kordiimonas sp. SCSIO 12610]
MGNFSSSICRSKLLKFGSLTTLVLLLAACGSSGPKRTYDDEGRERISILSSTQTLDADSAIANLPVVLPRPYVNKNWSQVGANANHSAQHLSLGDDLQQVWKANIGSGNRKYQRILTGPIAADGKVFAVDVKGNVAAVSLSSGNVIWRTELESADERSDVGFGGGVAYSGGKVFVSSGFGFVAALDGNSGNELWRYSDIVPFRGAPTVANGRVFSITQDNQLITLDAESGELLWDQVGIAETAGMLGAASPVFDNGTVVTALSSGELVAMLAANGRIVWQDALSSSRRLTPLATLADVDGEPVIDRGKLYAVSHAGRMVSIDMRSGERSWEADIAGVGMPWVAGNFGFTTTIDGQIVCINLTDGRIRWVTQLQRFEKQESRRGLIRWNGPVLAGDRLLVTSSHGYALSVSPYTGEVIGGTELVAGSTTPPIVVDNTFIFLSEEGELVAYR